MILPAGYEAMDDDELVAALVAEGVYDEDEARDVVELARGRAVVD